MSTDVSTRNGSATALPTEPRPSPDDELREWARAHVTRVHRLRFHLAAYVVGMAVLTPIWALVEWNDNGGFERFGHEANPGVWEPWILYVGLIWGAVVAFKALQVYFDRPSTEAEVDRALRRLKASR